MAQPSFKPEPGEQNQDGAVRLWISQRQWMSILQDTERQGREAPSDTGPSSINKRQSPRLPAPEEARCMIRLGDNTGDHGVYLVRLRDISASGLGFNSAMPFVSKTRCTIALQAQDGHGLVCAGRVVWCKHEDQGLHNVGIQFDRPIDPTRFSPPDQVSDPDAPDPEDYPDIPC